MPSPLKLISYDEGIKYLSWSDAVEALRAGHLLPRAEVGDVFLGPSKATLLNRSAYIAGLGYGVKAVTVFDENPKRGLRTVQGIMTVYSAETGAPMSLIDSRLVTELKTAADSVLGAKLLARPDSRHLLIIGAGTVAASLVRAYSEIFPKLEKIFIWTRRAEQGQDFVSRVKIKNAELRHVPDLEQAMAEADIIASATLARKPVLKGKWVRPGTHVDLIGAYKADMREADDALISSGSLFVDSRDTTIHHIGELMIPIAKGIISETAVKGDLYDLIAGETPGRTNQEEITIFKNGGGAHLDLMIAAQIAHAVSQSET